VAKQEAMPLVEARDIDPSCGLQWSPEGNEVAYVRHAGRGRYELWLMDADSKVSKLLITLKARRMQDLAWSPDGRWLAFVVGDNGAGYAIRALDLGSMKLTTLAGPMSGKGWVPYALSWSHDSHRLAFSYKGDVWIAAQPQRNS
jgi:Tol biopolymer transport system component